MYGKYKRVKINEIVFFLNDLIREYPLKLPSTAGSTAGSMAESTAGSMAGSTVSLFSMDIVTQAEIDAEVKGGFTVTYTNELPETCRAPRQLLVNGISGNGRGEQVKNEDEDEDEIDTTPDQNDKAAASRVCVFFSSMRNYVCGCVSSSGKKMKTEIEETKRNAIVYKPAEVTANAESLIDNQADNLDYPKAKEVSGAIPFKQRCIVTGYDMAACSQIQISLWADSHFQGFFLTQELLHQLTESEQDTIVQYCIAKSLNLTDLAFICVSNEYVPLNTKVEPRTEEGNGDTAQYERYVLLHEQQMTALRLRVLKP